MVTLEANPDDPKMQLIENIYLERFRGASEED
jgi:hypothetical protein